MYCFKVFWPYSATPNIQQSPHNDSDHVSEKSISHDFKDEMIPLLPELHGKDGPDRRLSRAVGGLKGAEIVRTDQTAPSLNHGISIQRIGDK